MKHRLIIVLMSLICLSFTNDKPIVDCKCQGIQLHGRVKIVTSHADFEIKIVNSFADLNVKKVTSLPQNCGEWQFVESSPDFTVKFVSSHPDFTIRYVNSFPGTP